MKFTIRDLLWLTLLAAVAVAWRVDRNRLETEIRSYVDPVDDLTLPNVYWQTVYQPQPPTPQGPQSTAVSMRLNR